MFNVRQSWCARKCEALKSFNLERRRSVGPLKRILRYYGIWLIDILLALAFPDPSCATMRASNLPLWNIQLRRNEQTLRIRQVTQKRRPPIQAYCPKDVSPHKSMRTDSNLLRSLRRWIIMRGTRCRICISFYNSCSGCGRRILVLHKYGIREMQIKA